MICTETGRVVYDEKLHAFNLRGRLRIATGISKPQPVREISRALGQLSGEYLTANDGTSVEDYNFILGYLEGLSLATRDREISATIDDMLFSMVVAAYVGTVYDPLDYPD